MIGGFYLMSRGKRVFKLRRALIEEIFSFEDWKWRIKVYETVSFEDMAWRFWMPVREESFYKDLSFLKPSLDIMGDSFEYQMDHSTKA